MSDPTSRGDWAALSPRLLSGYGLVEADFDRTTAVLGTYKRADQAAASIVGTTTDPRVAVLYLSHRTVPQTRLVFVDRGDWTVVLTNDRTGSDFDNHQYWASKLLAVRTIRVVDAEARWWRRGQMRERLGYEARIFHLVAPDGSTQRTVVCADDDGWVFETSGTPLPIEATFDYDAPRKKDRFTRQNLRDLLAAVGAAAFAAEDFDAAPRFALISEEVTSEAWRRRVAANACSLEEADDPAFGYYRRGMGWVTHMTTHYRSVIVDFERAIAINPEYEPKVRDYLHEARRRAAEVGEIQ